MELNSVSLAYLRRAARWLAIVFLAVAAVNIVVAANLPTLLCAGIASLSCWCAIAAVIEYVFLRLGSRDTAEPVERAMAQRRNGREKNRLELTKPASAINRFARGWQWLIFFGGVLGTYLFVRANIGPIPLEGQSYTALRVATVIYLVEGCIVYFIGNFVRAIIDRAEGNHLVTLQVLARFFALMVSLAAGLLFLVLSTTRDFTGWLGGLLIAITSILIFETLVRFGIRYYQPASLRAAPLPAGRSVLLEAAFGQGEGLLSGVQSFERLLGVKFSEVWIVRYVRTTFELVILGTLLLGWLSTCFTSVPAGSRGVRMFWGRYQEKPLVPGLHVTWPWPIERVEIVATENVRQISLGFDKDTSGPVLWTEPHFEGEKNLLVGDGESLLTINVPILYRISKPVRYLQTTTNAEQALLALAERKLIQVTGARGSFEIMTTERGEIADILRTRLQEEVDKLGLGLEVLFVGLKDVHPPVAVAPAYQEVVSAEEEKSQLVDMARASRAREMPTAEAEANRVRSQAEANAQVSVAGAKGAAARFLAVIQADRENSSLFRLRLKLDVIGSVLGKAKKTVVAVPPEGPKPEFYLDLRNTAEIPPP
jgi:HflK protein